MNLHTTLVKTAFAAATFAAGVLGVLPANAQGVQEGLQKTATAAFGAAPTVTDPAIIIGNVIKAALGLVSVIFFAFVIYGGFLWMTAGGNEQQIEKARKLVVNATIGIIIIAAGYAITTFVVNNIVAATQKVI
ncbi:hypothetical protein EPN90_02460 [Patescibacteria group bacterium]|nr:MAG: hypothetical protein EPN90_02460 [Patescibacteria group bacterium]